MLELIQENNVIIGIIIGIITLFITMRQIIISNQKHRMDKEDFISKKPNFSVYIENCYRISYNSSKHTHAVFCITIKNKSSYRNTVLPKLEIDYIENGIIRTIKLSHDKNLFHKKYHSQIEKYDNKPIISLMTCDMPNDPDNRVFQIGKLVRSFKYDKNYFKQN